MNGFNPKRKGGPTQRDIKTPSGNQQVINLVEYQQSFDKDAFSNLLKSQGVKVTHYRAIPDPTGMAAIGDVHAVQAKRSSSDGFLYKKVGMMFASFLNNSSNWSIEVEGMIKADMAVMTMPIQYEDCPSPVLVAPFDRFYIEDVEVRVVTSHYVEANTTGIDKLQYPATCVEHLVDADQKEYTEDRDFKITSDGHIQWISQNRPGFNEKTQRGTVYSIRYRYIPYFVVQKLLHEIRVSQITNEMTFERTLERMPYQILVIRENVISDMNKDPNQNMMDSRYQNAVKANGQNGGNDEGGKL